MSSRSVFSNVAVPPPASTAWGRNAWFTPCPNPEKSPDRNALCTSAPSRLTTGPRTPAFPAPATNPDTGVSITVPGGFTRARHRLQAHVDFFGREVSVGGAGDRAALDIGARSRNTVHGGPESRDS